MTVLRPTRRRLFYVPGQRFLVLLPMIAAPVVLAIDLASVALVHLSLTDDAGEAGRAGMARVQFERTATPQSAEVAYDAATEVAKVHDIEIDPASFTVYADGAVTLKATKRAPTLLFKHVPGLKDLTEATETVTVSRPRW
ncbi:hypothetical protein GCM10009547_44690 [Sporichthya brevicatena]|uniref:Uncharacterized protein n=1 Tax=Sporichthya brevicatena TaxID=171442 RepID=A0ABN1HAG8_9ACTN